MEQQLYGWRRQNKKSGRGWIVGMQFKFTKLIGAALLACGAMAAQAGKISAPEDTLVDNTVTLAGSVTYSVNGASGAALYQDYFGLLYGNDSDGINHLAQNWGGGWTLAAKDDVGGPNEGDISHVIQNATFKVNAGDPETTTGHWTLSASGLSSLLMLDMVVVLKASTEYALYYFQNVAIDGTSGGDWLSPVDHALSHMSVYLRPGTSGDFSGTAGELVTPQQGTAVAEPGSLALAGLGLLGVVAITRRKHRHGG
jgi:hypothetical protein